MLGPLDRTMVRKVLILCFRLSLLPVVDMEPQFQTKAVMVALVVVLAKIPTQLVVLVTLLRPLQVKAIMVGQFRRQST